MRVTPEQLVKMQQKGAKIVSRGKSIVERAVPLVESMNRSMLGIQNAIAKTRLKKPRMNKTESCYALQLQALKQCGQIVDYKFEGITLLLDDPSVGKKVRYTPDFLVIVPVEQKFCPKCGNECSYGGSTNNIYCLNDKCDLHIIEPIFRFEFHETKGSHIWEDAKLKFRWARQQYPWFKFHMKQYKDKQWNEIYPK